MCERSLSGSGAGPNAAASSQFVRVEMLPSGYLTRPYEGGGSIIHIGDHLNLEVKLADLLVQSFLPGKLFHLVISSFYRLGVCLRCCDHFMNPQKL